MSIVELFYMQSSTWRSLVTKFHFSKSNKLKNWSFYHTKSSDTILNLRAHTSTFIFLGKEKWSSRVLQLKSKENERNDVDGRKKNDRKKYKWKTVWKRRRSKKKFFTIRETRKTDVSLFQLSLSAYRSSFEFSG